MCYAGAIGMGLCTILMALSITGIAAVALSKDSSIHVMGMSSMDSPTIQNLIMSFFDSQWGLAIMIISTGTMLVGMWLSGKRRLMTVAIAGVASMFIGMYSYYSVVLQIAGAGVMALTHVSTFSYKVSRLFRIV